MGMLSQQNSSRFFGCSCLALAGCGFWIIMTCCVGLLALAIGIDVAEGNTFSLGDYHVAVNMAVGALAFVLTMIALVVVFAGYGLYLHNRKGKPQREPVRRRVVLLLGGLFVGGMILAAGIPGFAISDFNLPAWLKFISVIVGFLYFLFGVTMLWLGVQEYEFLAIHED